MKKVLLVQSKSPFLGATVPIGLMYNSMNTVFIPRELRRKLNE